MGGSLQASKPMKVTYLAGVVFSLFYAMYNTKPVASKSKDTTTFVDFIGNDPYKYEQYIKKLLQARGYNVRRTQSSGDYGVDVIASRDGKSFAIQCKLYNRPVGTKAVQEIVSGRIFYRTDFAIVVSDNSFTPAAKNLARKSDVTLAHHKNLLHKLEGLVADEILKDNKKPAIPDNNQASQEPAMKKQWTKQDADELITVVLPTITNDR